MSTFMYDMSKINVHWFPQHMQSGLELMKRLIRKCDIILDVRDARYVPTSSHNPLVDELARTAAHRIIVYNKSDLADPRASRRLEEFAESKWPGKVLLLSSQGKSPYEKLMHRVAYMARMLPSTTNNEEEATKLMVVGMPNVGKSTIINRLRSLGLRRGGRAVNVGDMPGVTKRVSGLVKILQDPTIYLWDSPGILMPKIADPHKGMRLAITGAIMDSVIGDHLLVDYLLGFLNSQGNNEYWKKYGLTGPVEDPIKLIEGITRTINAVNRNGVPNFHNGVRHILKAFREGELGRFTLDETPND